MDRKFKVLRLIGTIYKVIGIITGVITLLLAIGSCLVGILSGAAVEQFQEQFGLGVVSSAVGGIVAGGVILLYGVVMTLMLYGFGEGIYLALAVEENTRRTAEYLQQYSGEPQ